MGYFTDPILSTMLGYSDDALADLILHELTHATVFAPEHTDYNESLANFIGRRGSLQFLAHFHGPDTPLIEQARQRRRDAERFRSFMTSLVGQLTVCTAAHWTAAGSSSSGRPFSAGPSPL